MKRYVVCLLLLFVVSAQTGCGAGNVVPQPAETQTQPTRNDVLNQNLGGGCLEPDHVNSPWLVGLGADDRGTISRNAERGIVLVKQGDCGTFQMLRDCYLSDVKYVPMISSVVRPDSVEITDRVQMQKKIPMAMAKYKTDIADDEIWSLDYVDAGEYSYTGVLPQIDWNKLRPTCRAATHYVYKITRGAFQLSRVNSAERAREGKIGPADFSARAKRRVREKTRDGDYAKCAETEDATAAFCNGLIRMSVEPIPNGMLASRPFQSADSGVEGPEWDPTIAPAPSVNYGWINVTSNFKGVSVLVDGTEVGKTPLSEKRVGAGTHRVTLTSRCLHDGNISVTVGAGETKDVNVDLKPRNGALRILSVDDNGKPIRADVYLDGKKIGDTNGSLTATLFEASVCKSGKKLVVKAEGYSRYEKTVDIKERDYTDLTVALKPKIFSSGCKASPTGKGGPMCAIPSGNFKMGCNEKVDSECDDDEKPYRTVYLNAYYMDRHEVTVDEYRKCVKAGRCKTDGLEMPYWRDREQPDWAWACNWNKSGKDDHPINCIPWQYAVDYCEWANKRLPTEAEWEKAARGTDGRKYPWGNKGYSSVSRVANISDETAHRKQSSWKYAEGYDDGYYATAPVESYSNGKSPYGHYDMIGNVWEWVSDWYDKAFYDKGTDRNPKGAGTGKYRVLRGGSWGSEPTSARASYRGRDEPAKRVEGNGFRCALSSPSDF